MPSLQLNESMKVAVEIARSLAKEYQNEYFYPAHLLRAMLHKDVGLKGFLQAIGKDPGYIQEWAEIRMEEHPKSSRITDLVNGDEKVRALFDEAELLRIRMGQDTIAPILALAALAKPGLAFSADQLKSFPIKEKEVLDDYLQATELQQAVGGTAPEMAPAASGALFKYCIERTALARDGKTDPIVGRDKETRMVLEILCRRTKPNVIITGEAGVGKTALIDGLALDIVLEKVPPQIAGSLLYELDLGALVAGASYKGEVEDRLKNIIRELKQQPKTLLFIDEIHTLLDHKSGGPGSGAANLLKPELARGELTVIGATTTDEYRKFIETDQAFVRRFEVVQVAEPDEMAAQKMVRGLAPKFESHHQLTIDQDAIGDCVRLSKRYLKGRRLPDAAIDLLDGTMAAIKLMVQTNKQDLLQLQSECKKIEENAAADAVEKAQDYRWLISILHNKISPVLLGKLDDATQWDKLEAPEELEQYLDRSLAQLLVHADDGKKQVSREDIAAVVSYKTGIPLGKIQAQEQEKLLHMDAFLKRRVVGQDYAVKALCDAILESRSGLNKKGQPIGSFFFLGPTGTGKTELAKSIAEFLFLDEKAMIRFDMSEFKEEHSAALLYGAPPGYVGYEEGGMLVNKIRQKPYSVLLFDEIEKAHPSVFDTFLQILDEGHMHDRLGKEGDFSNALIIFTSNIGSEWIAEQFSADEVPSSNKLMELMARYFRPEFLARLTEIVPFAPIREDNIIRILEIQMRGLLEALDKQGINLHVSDEAKKYLALNGFTPKYGARQISGVIRNQLRRPISKYIVAGTLRKGNTVKVQLDQETLAWNIE